MLMMMMMMMMMMIDVLVWEKQLKIVVDLPMFIYFSSQFIDLIKFWVPVQCHKVKARKYRDWDK